MKRWIFGGNAPNSSLNQRVRERNSGTASEVFLRLNINRRGGVKNLVLLAVALCATTLLFCNTAEAFKLPDAGQTKCYQTVSPYAEMPCSGTGQDGAYIINPMSYTDNGNGTVTDNNTGLMWQQHDDGNPYNWYQASGTYDAGYNSNTTNVCGSLNLGGHSDWRLPSKKELINIVDYSIPYLGPTINATYFPRTPGSGYWASTIDVDDSSQAWLVAFSDGHVIDASKNAKNGLYVRCVRGDQPQQSFVDNGNGTVTDNITGLMWQQGEGGNMTWGSALSYCAGLTLAGNLDWRLPNVKELESLNDDTRDNPAIDTNFFPYANSAVYWTSDTYADNPVFAWDVWFNGGYIGHDGKILDFSYVRCVRGGQTGSLNNLALSVSKNGTGTGTVSSSPTGISCGATCSASFAQGASVTLSATPDTGSTFSGWAGGGCSGTGICVVTMNAANSVTATFTLNQYALTVNKFGTGSGTVSGGGTYGYGTSQQVTASASAGSTFNGWSGDCTGTTSTLSVLVDKAKACNATFTLNQYALTVNKSGTGNGTVSGGGTYDYGTSHDITAAASVSSTFTGWSGDCAGTASPLSVFVDKAKTCTATFSLNQNTLISLKAGWNLFGWINDTGYYAVTAPAVGDYASGANLTQVANIGDAMTQIGFPSGSYVVVIGPGGKVYVPSSSFNTLTGLMPGMAYWVYMNADASITLPGAVLPSGSTVTMPGGWIQAAYLGADGATPATGFACISGAYDVIVNGSGEVYIPGSSFNTLTNLNHAEGYFIHATGAGPLKYSCP